jgi:hypothetical protein
MEKYLGTATQSNAFTTLLHQIQAPRGSLQHLLANGQLSLFGQLATGTNPLAVAKSLSHLHVPLSAASASALHAVQAVQRQIGNLAGTSANGQPVINNPLYGHLTDALHQLGQDLARQMATSQTTAQTSVDKLNQAQQNAINEWSQVGHRFAGTVTLFDEGSKTLAKGANRLLQGVAHGAGVSVVPGLGLTWSIRTQSDLMPGGSGPAPNAATLDAFTSGGGLGQSLLWGLLRGKQVASLTDYLVPPTTPSPTPTASGPVPHPTVPLLANDAAFLKFIGPLAQTVHQQTGLPVSFLEAQAAVESGWGTSLAAHENANFAGIKPWAGAGAGVDSKYAGYASPTAFAQGWAAFYLDNNNYAPLLAAARHHASASTLTKLIQESGYATSSTYGQTLLSVMQQIEANTRPLKHWTLKPGTHPKKEAL